MFGVTSPGSSHNWTCEEPSVEREKSNLEPADLNLVLLLASSSASLDESPKKNWVENSGGLPPYVRKLARGIMKTGKSKSQAIAIAISRIKKWAAGGDDVNADTKAKAAKALAQWEKLKGKNAAKQVVKTTHADETRIFLAADGAFNVDAVRRSWEDLNRQARAKYADANMPMESPFPWIREVWNEYVIVEIGERLFKVPYDVENGVTTFHTPVPVEVTYKEIGSYDNEDDSYGDLDEQEVALLGLTRLDTEHRDKLAKKGKALPGGGFPIVTVVDLKNAIQAIGRAKDPAKAKAHIKKMAAKLGRTDLIPENW
jgi:hypothetical protein